jgi:hypothetical protein
MFVTPLSKDNFDTNCPSGHTSCTYRHALDMQTCIPGNPCPDPIRSRHMWTASLKCRLAAQPTKTHGCVMLDASPGTFAVNCGRRFRLWCNYLLSTTSSVFGVQ